MVNGKPTNKTEATSIDEALKMLEDDKKSQGEDKLITEKFVFSKNPEQRKDQQNRFARLLRSKDFQARRVAAKVLGRSDELDMVPELIYALSDPDAVVCRNAETSLRLLSRQLDRYHIPKEGNITEQHRVVARREWRAWFSSMRPDYIFVE
jgi:HEAT repeat protein